MLVCEKRGINKRVLLTPRNPRLTYRTLQRERLVIFNLTYAPVSQLVEERGSDPRKCEFDSRQEYANHGPVVELADTAISKVAVFGRPGSSPGRATELFTESKNHS